MSKHIVILGAGYGGVLSALTVRKHYTKEQARVTVVKQIPNSPNHYGITPPCCRQRV